MPKLIRITTAPISLKYLLPGQMRFMREHGLDVVMSSSDGRELADVIRNEACRHVIIPMNRQISPASDLKNLWKLYKFFRKEKPDIVHSHTPKAGLLAMLAARMARVPIRIHTVAGLRFMTSTGKTRSLLVAMEKLTARAATHVWPNSPSLLKYILDNKLAPAKKLEVIAGGSSNGIDLTRFNPGTLDMQVLNEVKQKISFDPALTYFVCAGRIVRDKGIDELLDAFQRVHQVNPATRLILVGAFEDELDPISDHAREILRNDPSVIQPGWSDHVEYYMHLAFALIHPSHREGFPNVLLQAGAMDCPIICSRIEGNIDIVEHGVTGLIFTARNADQLYEHLLFALQNPATMKGYAMALKTKIRQSFERGVIHQAMLERYNQLLS